MSKITIIGSGALGTAIGKTLVSNNHNVIIYGINKKELHELSQGKNTKYFPRSIWFPNFKTSNNLASSLQGAHYIFIALPSIAINLVFPEILRLLKDKVIIINGSKGFYPNTLVSIHQKMSELSHQNKYVKGIVSLVGPSHAEEIVKEGYVALCAIDYNVENCQEVQKIFHGSNFRVYVQTDVIGAELSTAFKNVVAILCGMAKEKGFGINTQAAIITRSLEELKAMIKYRGGNVETAMGLAGVGDLIVTATSDLSRNYTFGREFIRNGRAALKTNKTVEGLAALKAFFQLNESEMHLDLPIINFLYCVIYQDQPLEKEIQKILNRKLKNEF